MHIILFFSQQASKVEVSTIVLFILRIRKLNLKKVKELVQANEW